MGPDRGVTSGNMMTSVSRYGRDGGSSYQGGGGGRGT